MVFQDFINFYQTYETLKKTFLNLNLSFEFIINLTPTYEIVWDCKITNIQNYKTCFNFFSGFGICGFWVTLMSMVLMIMMIYAVMMTCYHKINKIWPISSILSNDNSDNNNGSDDDDVNNDDDAMMMMTMMMTMMKYL